MNFERIFNDYCAVLEKYKEQLYNFQFYPDSLNEVRKTLNTSEDAYSYSFSTIRFLIPQKSRPNHCIPKSIGDIEIVLSIKDDIIIKRTKDNYIEDPLCKLERFNIILNCENKYYTSSWHLDRHLINKDEPPPSSLHPIYHLTFGGHYMEELQKNDTDEFGKALIVRAPRIMHPPMELLLGIDYIFCHFIPKDDLDLLIDKSYLAIIRQLKKYFWLPFNLAVARNYCDSIEVDGTRFQFDEKFVSSVLSC